MEEILSTPTVVAALIGGVVGSLLTSIANFFLQRAQDNRKFKHEQKSQQKRWDREDRTRHDEHRLKAYRDMYYATTDDKLGLLKNENQQFSGVDRERLVAGVDAISLCHSEIQLIAASNEVTQVSQMILHEALVLREAVKQRIDFSQASGEPWSPTPQQVGELWHPIVNQREKFRAAVQKELRIPDSLS